MPKPNPGESKEAFVSRYMASPEAQRDFPDETQRAAVAYSTFGEKKNGALCVACGADMDGAVCSQCGRQEFGAPTPPVEGLKKICPACQDPVDPEHDDFGCHVPGCGCAKTAAELMDPRAILPNAGPDKKEWDIRDEAGKEEVIHLHTAGGRTQWFPLRSGRCQDCEEAPPAAVLERFRKGMERGNENATLNKMACPACGSHDTLKTMDSHGGRFQMGAKPTDAWECHACDNMWMTDPLDGNKVLQNGLTPEVLRSRIAEWKQRAEDQTISPEERAYARTIQGNLQTELDKVTSGENKNAENTSWLQRVANASGVPLEEVQRKWREHVRTVSNEDPEAFKREFLEWYSLKENAMETRAAFEAHAKECAGCMNAYDSGKPEAMCDAGAKILANREVEAKGGEEAGKPGGTVTVVNAADKQLVLEEISKIEKEIAALRAAAKTPENERTLKVKETTLAGLRRELSNADESAWKDSSDYAEDGGCKKCGWGAPGTGHSSGYHKDDCKVLAKERARFEHLQGAERRNASEYDMTEAARGIILAGANPTAARSLLRQRYPELAEDRAAAIVSVAYRRLTIDPDSMNNAAPRSQDSAEATGAAGYGNRA